MLTTLANAQYLAKHAPTQAQRDAAAKRADAILAAAAAMLDSAPKTEAK